MGTSWLRRQQLLNCLAYCEKEFGELGLEAAHSIGSAKREVRFNYSKISYPLLCCCALLACIALAWPFAPTGFNDDWAYAHVALKLAETGELQYNGWGSPTMLFQAFWGAAWIRTFGFSFDVLRAATIPFSLGFVLLVYAIARRFALAPNFALFAAITVGTSPLFLPMAASFMTDVYGCFFISLCIYAALASAESASGALAAKWLWILAASGILGGSDRQIVWVAPFILIPYLLWLRRQDRRFRIHAVAAYALCIVSLAFIVVRLPHPPYSPLELSARQLLGVLLHRGVTGLSWIAKLALSLLLCALPAIVCLSVAWKKLGVVRLIESAIVSAAAAVLLLHQYGGRFGLAPFFGNILSPFGVLWPQDYALGYRPAVLPDRVREGLTWFLLFSIVAFGYLYVARRAHFPRIPTAMIGLFSCAYAVLLFPGALLGPGFLSDRYVLPLLPWLVILILVAARSYIQAAPLAGWVCVLVFAAYGVATTHDYFEGLRARALAARALEDRGIPRTSISAGLEYDGWTQLQSGGIIKQLPLGHTFEGNSTDNLWYWQEEKGFRPQYVVSYWRVSDLPAGRLVTIPFRACLPPFRRAVVVLKRADLPKP